jgi:hypothetical protein
MLNARPDLPLVLKADAASCLLMGLALATMAGSLSLIFNLPADLVRIAGAVLLPCAALFAIAGFQHRPPKGFFAFLVIVNTAWIAASVALIADPAIELSAAGVFFVAVQALAVAVLTIIELAAWRAGRFARVPAQ